MADNQDSFIQPDPGEHYGFLKDLADPPVSHQCLSPGVVEHCTAGGRIFTSIRLLLPSNGLVAGETLLSLAALMRDYRLSGRRTVRQGFELIAGEGTALEELFRDLKDRGFVVGGTGFYLHQIESCIGFIHCQNAVVDSPSLTQSLWEEFQKFAAKPLPNALKIGVSGCPNQCGLAVLNDLGLSGVYLEPPAIKTELLATKKLDLKLLRQSCPNGALKIFQGPGDLSMQIDRRHCTRCSSCAQTEPEIFVLGGPRAILITLKQTRSGEKAAPVELIPVEGADYRPVIREVRRLVDLWIKNAFPGEEIAQTLRRTGVVLHQTGKGAEQCLDF